MSDANDGVGSLVDEASKLFGALSGWAREQTADADDGLSGLAAQAAGSVQELNDHIATGSAECTICPICRGVHALRQLSPEVKAHLAAAATSLAAAATTLMATHVPQDKAPATDVERTDLKNTVG